MEKKHNATDIVKSNYIEGALKILANVSMPSIQKFLTDYGKVVITILISSVLLLSIDFVMFKMSQFLLYGAIK